MHSTHALKTAKMDHAAATSKTMMAITVKIEGTLILEVRSKLAPQENAAFIVTLSGIHRILSSSPVASFYSPVQEAISRTSLSWRQVVDATWMSSRRKARARDVHQGRGFAGRL